MPCAPTMSHAVAVTNASAEIVLATIAVETVVVVEPIVVVETAVVVEPIVVVETAVVVEPIVSAEMAKASVVKKTLACRGALGEKAGRERRVANLCKSRARRDE